jgi:G:T/U-mismatch repair DNA glycosylase
MSNATPENPQPLRIAGLEIPFSEQTSPVLALLAVTERLVRENQELRDEIQRRKGTTRRPQIKPSRLL